jgi:hypothetical protein
MNNRSTVTSIAAVLAASTLWASRASAQDAPTTTTTTTEVAPATAPPAPATSSQTNVYVQPAPVGQTTTTAAPVMMQPGPVPENTTEGYAPNTVLLTTGLLLFGIPYVSSVVVAASSDHDGDHHLYIPLAGPWIDMANRGGCPVSSNGCDNETTYKVLLGVDGVFQAVGALEIVGAFLSPEKRKITTVPATAYTPEITLQPTKVGGTGYGLGAFARF